MSNNAPPCRCVTGALTGRDPVKVLNYALTGKHPIEALNMALFERDQARKEIDRLKEVVAAKPLDDGKTLRVEMSVTPEGKPCLIVTAPHHWEEEKIAKEIAGVMDLWVSVAGGLAHDKQVKDLTRQRDEARSDVTDLAWEIEMKWRPEVMALRAALAELVAIKDLGGSPAFAHEYLRRKPLAWEAARRALS